MQRPAFSLIELLVVIAIIIVLMGILLPAILKVHEASNKIVCSANMRQVALAAHNFHSVNETFPPGYLGPNPIGSGPELVESSYTGEYYYNFQHVSLFLFLLPHLEEDNAYKIFTGVLRPSAPKLNTGDPDPTRVNRWDRYLELNYPPDHTTEEDFVWARGQNPTTRSMAAVAQTKLSLLVCPSDDPYKLYYPGGVISAKYVWKSDEEDPPIGKRTDTFATDVSVTRGEFLMTHAFLAWERDEPFGRTNYLGCEGSGRTGLANWDRYRGFFTNRSTITSEQVVSGDGMSNTLFFGEALGGSRRKDGLDRAYTWMGVGTLTSPGGIPSGDIDWRGFSSLHPGGVQFAFGDGSVRTLNRDVPNGILSHQRMEGSPTLRNDTTLTEFDLPNALFIHLCGIADRKIVDLSAEGGIVAE